MKYVSLNPLKQISESSFKKKSSFGTFDCETKDGLLGKELFCWAFCVKNKNYKNQKYIVYYGHTIEEFFKQVIEIDRKNTLVIYVHNLGFDIRFIEDYCIRHKIERKPLLSGSKVIAYTIDKYHIKFIDSVQFLFTSQEKAEIEWNIEEKYRKIDCSDLFNISYDLWSEEDKIRILEHNKNDVMALHSIMEQFREVIYEIAHVDVLTCISLASLSMKAFRCQMKTAIDNPYLYFTKGSKYGVDKEKYEFVKASYFGGRTEVFDLNLHQNIKYIDRVSMYPSEMVYNELPTGIPEWYHNENEILNLIQIQKKLGIIECQFTPKNLKYPVLPIKKFGKVCFTNEKNIGVFASCEVLYAIEMGYDISIKKALIFPTKEFIFTEHINNLYQIKANNTGGRKMAGKILMNSLYGKFGMDIYRKEPVFIYKETPEEIEEYLEEIGFMEKVKIEFSEEFGQYYCVIIRDSESKKAYQIIHIASFITSYARVSLLRFIHELESKGIPVVYCDTDSVSISAESLDSVKLGHDLGNWDIEQEFKQIKFLAPKSYIFQNEDNSFGLKLKGCDRAKIKEFTDNAKTIQELEEFIREPIEMLERYDTFNHSLRYGYALKTKKLCKHFSFEFSKRKVLADLTTEAWN